MNGSIEFGNGDTPSAGFAGEDAAFKVVGISVGVAAWLPEDGDAVGLRPRVHAVSADVAPDEYFAARDLHRFGCIWVRWGPGGCK